jgi:hypothetical protein
MPFQGSIGNPWHIERDQVQAFTKSVFDLGGLAIVKEWYFESLSCYLGQPLHTLNYEVGVWFDTEADLTAFCELHGYKEGYPRVFNQLVMSGGGGSMYGKAFSTHKGATWQRPIPA